MIGSGNLREINWDGVPETLASPNAIPGDFFNTVSPRGAVFSTPGTGFQVSARASSGNPVRFGNINPAYPTLFTTFSAERLFTAVGSNIIDVRFFIPGTTTPTTTWAFGSVFSDVDLSGSSSLQFFGTSNENLGTFSVPSSSTSASNLSFLGVIFATDIVSSVRIIAGNAALGSTTNESSTTDLVVLDDVIYGLRPVTATAVPEASTYALGSAGCLLLMVFIRRLRGKHLGINS